MSKVKIIIFFVISLCQVAFAQEIKSSIEPAFGTSEDLYYLEISASGSKLQNLQLVNFKENDLFEINQQGQSTRRQIINGKESSESILTFQVRFKKEVSPGDYQLPSGTLRLNGEKVDIPQKKITIVTTASPRKKTRARKQNSHPGVRVNQYLDKKKAYVGEQITYTAEITHDNTFVGGSLEDNEVSGFWRERLGRKERNVFNLAGKTVSTFQEVLIPIKSGKITIPPRVLQAKIRTQRRTRRRRPHRGSIFENFSMFNHSYTRKNLRTNSLTINITPLPPTPLSGYIPVGIVQAKTSVDKNKLRAGESANMTVTIQGTANLRPFKLKEVKRKDDNFKLYFDSPALRTGVQDGTVVFSKTFNVNIIPTKSGSLDVPQFTINYFDTEEEKYKKIQTKEFKLNVIGDFPKENDKLSIVEEKELKKEDILKEGELAPIQASSNLRKANWKLSHINTLIISFLILLVGIASRIYLQRKAFYLKNPEYLKRQNALKIALEKLEPSLANPLNAESIIKEYIQNAFTINTSTLTTQEIVNELDLKTSDKNKVEQMKNILLKLEQNHFSKNTSKINTNNSNVDINSLKDLLERLDEES